MFISCSRRFSLFVTFKYVYTKDFIAIQMMNELQQ